MEYLKPSMEIFILNRITDVITSSGGGLGVDEGATDTGGFDEF